MLLSGLDWFAAGGLVGRWAALACWRGLKNGFRPSWMNLALSVPHRVGRLAMWHCWLAVALGLIVAALMGWVMIWALGSSSALPWLL